MIFKHKHLLDELRSTGRQASAEVLSMKTLGGGSHLRAMWAPDEDLTSGWMDCWMKLRVTPGNKGEAPFETNVMTRVQTFKYQGSMVPVWYDPSDHSRVVVDYEGDVQAVMHAGQEADRLRHRYDQLLGLVWTPVGGDLLPLEATYRRGKGHVNVEGRNGGPLREPAQAALAFVRDHAASLVPELPEGWFSRHDIQVEQPFGGFPAGLGHEDAAGAGLAMAVALISLLDGRLAQVDVALTGGLSADGTLRPVAGLASKAAAAKHLYVKHFVVPAGNQADIAKIPSRQRQDLQFTPAATVEEAARAALARHRAKGYVPPA